MAKRKCKFSTVSIPTPLFEKIKKRIRGTGFTSVSSYVTFVLREILTEEAEKKLTEKDEEEIRKRLQALGYI